MAYKVGWKDNQLYLERHVPLQEQMGTIATDKGEMEKVISIAAAKNPAVQVNWDLAKNISKAMNGIPQVISSASADIAITN